jgi:tripartite-type tricarboxylate transporter receptor subunit TctC
MLSARPYILLCAGLIAAAMAAVGNLAAAADSDFPARPVRMLIPYPPGGGLDPPGRSVAEKFAQHTGRQLVIDNRGGAGGLIAGEIVANATPDGYTLLLASNGQVSIAPALYAKLPYDPARDLVPVTHFVDTPMFLFSNTSFPVQSVQDLIERAKASPGKIGIALSGVGGLSHLTMELFRQRAGITLLGVPYKGAGAAMVDVASGSVPLIFTTASSARPLLESKRIRPLAIAAKKRSTALPDVPSFEELGLSGMDAPLWIGAMAPKNTPERIIAKLHAEFAQALASKDVQERLAAQSAEIVAAGPKAFGETIRRDTERWDRVVKTAGIKIEK